MGCYPTIIENTLEQALTNEFWEDLFLLLRERKNRLNIQLKDESIPIEEREYLPDAFCELDEEWTVEDLKYQAFNSDHMEHVGNWLYSQSVWPVFKKHKISGSYVLHHRDGGGYYKGIIFVEGAPYDAQVRIKIETGDLLCN